MVDPITIQGANVSCERDPVDYQGDRGALIEAEVRFANSDRAREPARLDGAYITTTIIHYGTNCTG